MQERSLMIRPEECYHEWMRKQGGQRNGHMRRRGVGELYVLECMSVCLQDCGLNGRKEDGIKKKVVAHHGWEGEARRHREQGKDG